MSTPRIRLDRFARWTGQPVVFPFYHVVSDEPLSHVAHLYRQLRVEEFLRDLEEMTSVFEPVSLKEYLDSLSGDQVTRKGKRRMALSFDDGLAECHSIVAPILRRKGIPATFFLNNQFIDNRGMFFRFRVSILADAIRKDPALSVAAAQYLGIREGAVLRAILMVNRDQEVLLDGLAGELGVDLEGYQKTRQVYMSSPQVAELLDWGFEIGGHSMDHKDFRELGDAEMAEQVKESVEDLCQRYGAPTRYFSFPFTSDGVSRQVIESLLTEGQAEVLLGTAGLKRTGNPRFIQRIPMEEYTAPASDALKAEYLYFLLKAPLGKNRLRF